MLVASLVAALPCGLALAEAGPDPHAAHRAQMAVTTTRSVVHYSIPQIELVRDDDRAVRLDEELGDGRPVVLAFVYTSCTTVCPLTSATLAQLQSRLGSERERVHLASISIDPERDTPARLREYARQFHAGPEWRHYTGTVAASEATQRAFGAFRGSKMDHQPVVLVRAAPGGDWVRFEGFPTADEVLAELPRAHAQR
jgi:protein SCO1/2